MSSSRSTGTFTENTPDDLLYLNLRFLKPNEYNRFLYASLYCLNVRCRDNITVRGDQLIARNDVDEHKKECVNNNNGDKCNHTVHMLREFYSPKDLRSLHGIIELIALNNDVFETSHGGDDSLFLMYYNLSSWSQLSYKESTTDTIDEAIEKFDGIFDSERKEVIVSIMKNVLTARGDVELTPRQGYVHNKDFDWNILFPNNKYSKRMNVYKKVAAREVKEDTAVGLRSAADPTLIEKVVQGPLKSYYWTSLDSYFCKRKLAARDHSTNSLKLIAMNHYNSLLLYRDVNRIAGELLNFKNKTIYTFTIATSYEANMVRFNACAVLPKWLAEHLGVDTKASRKNSYKQDTNKKFKAGIDFFFGEEDKEIVCVASDLARDINHAAKDDAYLAIRELVDCMSINKSLWDRVQIQKSLMDQSAFIVQHVLGREYQYGHPKTIHNESFISEDSSCGFDSMNLPFFKQTPLMVVGCLHEDSIRTIYVVEVPCVGPEKCVLTKQTVYKKYEPTERTKFKKEVASYLAIDAKLQEKYKYLPNQGKSEICCLEMRYCGDKFLKVYREDTRTIEHICNLAGSFVQMIMLMHQAKIIHSDIKHSNIGVVGADIRPFDMDCSIHNSTLNFSDTVPMEGGTYKTMAPEQICDKQCCFASDMWAVGLVLLEALLGSDNYKSFYERYLVALSYYEHKSKVKCTKSYSDLKSTDLSNIAEGLKFCPLISQEFGEKMVGFIISNLLVIDYTKRATAEQWLTLMIHTDGIKEKTRVHNITIFAPSECALERKLKESEADGVNIEGKKRRRRVIKRNRSKNDTQEHEAIEKTLSRTRGQKRKVQELLH